MSSLFQAQLEGNELNKSPLNVAFGSVVTIKSYQMGGGLLHSHVQTFPEGSRQQQVTTYFHSDLNNEWLIFGTKKDFNLSHLDKGYVPFAVEDKATIRLFHQPTRKYLISSKISAPLTTQDWEVSCYVGEEAQKIDKSFEHPENIDLWQIEVTEENPSSSKNVQTLLTKFRLRHVVSGCYLKATGKSLPDWGFRQGEVTCDHLHNEKDLKNHDYWWNVEKHHNIRLEPGEPDLYQTSFLKDVIYHNIRMFQYNQSLVQDEELEPGNLVSTPDTWFWLKKGLRMCGFGDQEMKFFMIGNPLVWWGTAFSIIMLSLLLGAYTLMDKRQALNWSQEDWQLFMYRMKVTVGGWLINFLPFYFMGRVLYLHHYFPSLTFGILACGFLFEHFTARISNQTKNILAISLIGLLFGLFLFFSPFCYGFNYPLSELKYRKWIKSWDL